MFRSRTKFSVSLFKRWYSIMSSLSIKETLKLEPSDKQILVQGWVQAVREYKDLYFVDLVDGTCSDKLQLVIPRGNSFPEYGSSIKVTGSIVKSSHKGQAIELSTDSWNTIGKCADDYPFHFHQKYSSEYIRQFLHLRPRTRQFSSILRIRNQASIAIHHFFQNEGFCFVHTPIITQNDCEGAGEVFKIEPKESLQSMSIGLGERLDKNEFNLEENKQISVSNVPTPNIQEHFFNDPAYLTVSGQLHLEAMACALRKVYNFGPIFRADNSKSRFHLSEFYMIEAEESFITSIDHLMMLVEKCIKKITESILENCSKEVSILTKELNNHNFYLEKLVSIPFKQLTYDEAAAVLLKKKTLSVPFKMGEDFSTEHKQILVEHCGKFPVFITMFPCNIKPFYMKSCGNKSQCFDLFAPHGGEICGGSLREESEDKLKEKHAFKENDPLEWYLDLRKYGTVPHGGFGIGFDRLLQSILGMANIKDIVPFPRRKYDCKC